MFRRDKPRGATRIAIALSWMLLYGVLAGEYGGHTASVVAAGRQDVQIGVLGLFHPRELGLEAIAGSPLVVELGSESRVLKDNDGVVSLVESAGYIELRFVSDETARRTPMRGERLTVGALSGGDACFWLQVTGKITGRLRRRYQGTLEVAVKAHVLQAVVTMPLETAVASIVMAESPPGAGLEALKAQAVASRSFLAARQSGHLDFDFCDTTHCQFMRSPPEETNPAWKAALETTGLVMAYRTDAGQGEATDQPIAAMYSRSCGGRTRTLREIGMRSNGGYPYYAVRCTYCLRHPERWTRAPGAHASTERERMAWNRVHGWGAIPGLPEDTDKILEGAQRISGRGIGHGLGLCQLGAADMARHGAGFAEILMHYYPNTMLASISDIHVEHSKHGRAATR